MIALLLTGAVSAQSSRVVERSEDGKTVTITRIIRNNVNKHDIRIGVGPMSFSSSIFLGEFGYDDMVMEESFRHKMTNADTYLTKRRYIGTYSLCYTYSFRRWFQFGGTAMVSAVTQSRRSSITNKRIEGCGSYLVGVMPTVRFTYLNREKVQLYSALSFGLFYEGYEVLPWGDATLFGCSFGRKLFGFAEIGSGMGGWGRVGIGYRFDANKK